MRCVKAADRARVSWALRGLFVGRKAGPHSRFEGITFMTAKESAMSLGFAFLSSTGWLAHKTTRIPSRTRVFRGYFRLRR